MIDDPLTYTAFTVVPSFQDPDKMEEICKILGQTNIYRTDIWCDKIDFEEFPELVDYVERGPLLVELLDSHLLDFIAFRLDE